MAQAAEDRKGSRLDNGAPTEKSIGRLTKHLTAPNAPYRSAAQHGGGQYRMNDLEALKRGLDSLDQPKVAGPESPTHG